MPFIIFALLLSLFSLPPINSRNSDPGHIAGSSPPLPTTFRALHSYREKISPLSSLVDSRRIVLMIPTIFIGALSSPSFLVFAKKKKSLTTAGFEHTNLRTNTINNSIRGISLLLDHGATGIDFDLFPERARLAPPWPLTSSHLNTASCYYLRDLSSFSLIYTFFCTWVLSPYRFHFDFFVCSVVSSFFYFLLQVWFVRTCFSSFERFFFSIFSLILILCFRFFFGKFVFLGVELANWAAASKVLYASFFAMSAKAHTTQRKLKLGASYE